MEQRLHFDTVARLYESARPGYPSLLIDDLLWLSKIAPGAHILDIGCGTGKSTEPFAMRGFSVCALDPGANMLAVCKEKLRMYPNVRYENAGFEQWSSAGQVFDLVISGTAFHWVTAAGHGQLMRVLKAQGAVGIFWHTYLNGQGPVYDQLSQAYRQHAPDLAVDDPDAVQELSDRRKEEHIASWAGFGEWRVIRYYDQVRYTAAAYLDLMRTWSTHAHLGQDLYSAVAAAIAGAGGELVKPLRTTLCFGRRVTV